MKRLTISLPDDLYEALKAEADSRPGGGVSISQVIREAVEAWLKKETENGD